MTFRVMLRLEVEPGREAEFEKAWQEGTEAVTGHPASIGQSLSRETVPAGAGGTGGQGGGGGQGGPDDPNESDAAPSVYVIVSDWVDEPRFREFEQSPEHLRHRATLHPFRKSGSFHVMEVVSRIEGKAADAG